MAHIPSTVKNFNSLPEVDFENGTKSTAALKDGEITYFKSLYTIESTYMFYIQN